jgi:ATP-dependent RNA helicase RhlE
LTTFDSLNLAAPILKAVKAEGYETPTPIQAQAIPPLMQGRDLLGIAQTGTGKTAAFALPILHRLSESGLRAEKGTCRTLILSPTRELTAQIHESFQTYGKNLRLKSVVVFGGVSINKQIEAVRSGVDVLVATPGRLVDLIERRVLSLSKVETFVLDEVDQMLDLGFIHAIRKITGMLPKDRQNLFFSATMPKEIAGLAANLLRDPVRVEITPVATTAERVIQSVIHVDPANKLKLLVDVLRDPQITRALIFTRTKHGADKVVKALAKENYESAAIHGNKSQANRERALAGFKAGKILALVATDIAARGIDVDGVSHVFNYDLPFVPESYVHRIGRTARAGAAGEAIAFCTPEDRGLLRDIEKTIRQQVPIKDHELGLKVDPLVPNFGWNPVREPRKSGGGRHMPKAQAKKPHHRGQAPQQQPGNPGRHVEGDAQAPHERRQQQAKAAPVVRTPMPTEPFRPKRVEDNTGKPTTAAGQPVHHARKDGFGKKKGFAGPKRSGNGGGSWMKKISGE